MKLEGYVHSYTTFVCILFDATMPTLKKKIENSIKKAGQVVVC